MKHPRTLYAILSVTPDADPDVVRAAYRALAKKYHPDVAGKFQMSDLAFRAVAEARRGSWRRPFSLVPFSLGKDWIETIAKP